MKILIVYSILSVLSLVVQGQSNNEQIEWKVKAAISDSTLVNIDSAKSDIDQLFNLYGQPIILEGDTSFLEKINPSQICKQVLIFESQSNFNCLYFFVV